MSYLQARSEEEKNHRKEAIVSAAKELFYHKGYGVAVDEIAEKAKLSKATLYLYYRNKDELYVAAMMEGFRGLEQRFTAAARSGGPVEARLQRTYNGFIDYMLANKKFFRITQHYLAEDFPERISDDPAHVVQATIVRHLGYVEALVREGIDTGLLRQDLDANAYTTIFWRTCTGLLDLAAVDKSANTRKGRWAQIFATAFSVLLEGARSANKPRGRTPKGRAG